MRRTGTKFWLAVGVEVALLLVLLLIVLALPDKFSDGLFIAWLGAFVAVPTQFGLTNVIASGQAAKSNSNGAGLPGS